MSCTAIFIIYLQMTMTNGSGCLSDIEYDREKVLPRRIVSQHIMIENNDGNECVIVIKYVITRVDEMQ